MVTRTRDRDESMPHLYVKTADLFSMTGRDRRDYHRQLVSKWKLDREEGDLLEDNVTRFDDGMTKDPNIVKVSTVDENLRLNSSSRKSEADVTEIFVRVNRQGTDLSRSDLIFSMLKLNWKESAEALPEFVRIINLGNSFDITTDFVIRCLFAVCDLGAKMDLDLLRKRSNVQALQESFDACCDAIRASVDFVSTQCRCQSASLVGGLNTLVPIVYYFFRLPKHEVPNSEVKKLRSAIYVLGFSKALSRYGEGRIGNFIRRELRPLAEAGSTEFPYERLVRYVASWQKTGVFDSSFAANNVQLALHLIQGLHGSRVQYAGNSPEVDHIFPKATLRQKGYDGLEIDTVANFWILARGKNRNKSHRRCPHRQGTAGLPPLSHLLTKARRPHHVGAQPEDALAEGV